MAGPGKEIGAVQEKVPNLEVETNTIEIRVEMKIGDRVGIIQETEKNRPRSESRSRSSSCVSTNRDRCGCYRCNEYDHFARECPNIVTDGSSDEMGDSLLQMLDPDETLALNYAEGEDFDMDLNM